MIWFKFIFNLFLKNNKATNPDKNNNERRGNFDFSNLDSPPNKTYNNNSLNTEADEEK